MKLPNLKINKESMLQGDSVVWMILFALCMISVVEVYSASSRMTYKIGVHYWGPVMEHSLYMMLGIFVTWLVHKMPCAIFKILCTVGMFASLIMLVVVLFKGRVNDAARWLSVFGFTIQPSEFAKISLVGTAATLLATLRDKKTGEASMLALKWVGGLTAISCLLIVSENFSTAGIIFMVMLMMAWYAQASKKWLWIIFASVVLTGGAGYCTLKFVPEQTAEYISENTPLHRFHTWSNRIKDDDKLPEDPMDYNIHDKVQVTHARIAVGTCNVVGKGPGQSEQREYLPHAYSDFIYAIIIEEAGIEGGVLVMFLYLLLLYRAMRIAEKCKNRFPAYLVMGLSLMIVVQAMLNMAVSVGAFPVTGQPLPLVSKGGTSTFITCAYIGMILSVSHTAKRKDEEQKKEETEITQ